MSSIKGLYIYIYEKVQKEKEIKYVKCNLTRMNPLGHIRDTVINRISRYFLYKANTNRHLQLLINNQNTESIFESSISQGNKVANVPSYIDNNLLS